MTNETNTDLEEDQLIGWYSIRAKVKREQVAACSIRKIVGMQVFAPQITFMRKTKQGPKRFTEALFPGYIFVHGNFFEHRRHLMAMNGVVGAVHFADHYPRLPQEVIDGLREHLGGDHAESKPRPLQPGDEVQIAEGPFAQMAATVCSMEKGSDRVAVLIDFLGRNMSVHVPRKAVFDPHEEKYRDELLSGTPGPQSP